MPASSYCEIADLRVRLIHVNRAKYVTTFDLQLRAHYAASCLPRSHGVFAGIGNFFSGR